MKNKIKRIALSTVLLLFGVSIFLNIVLIKDGVALNKLLTEKGTIILTPSITEMLLSELKSADKTRLEEWCTFLYQSGRYGTNLNLPKTNNAPATNRTTD